MRLVTPSRLSSLPDDSISRVRCHASLSPALSLLHIFLTLLRHDVYRLVLLDARNRSKNQYGARRCGCDRDPPKIRAPAGERLVMPVFDSLYPSVRACNFWSRKRQLERMSASLCSSPMLYSACPETGAPKAFLFSTCHCNFEASHRKDPRMNISSVT